MGASSRLRRLMAGDGLVVAPGVFDGLSARLAEVAGFEVLYVTGGGIARGAGLPELGLLAMTEVAERMAQIADVVALPLIADADTGYGNALNVQRTMRAFERAGVAGLHLEAVDHQRIAARDHDEVRIAPRLTRGADLLRHLAASRSTRALSARRFSACSTRQR